MTTLNHRNRRAVNNHSIYQTDLHTSTNSLLSAIKENTANINLNVDTLEVNTDGLEALQTTANTTLASILVDTDAADSSLNTIEAQSVLTASRLNNIQNKLNVNTDGTGDTLGQIANNILSKNTDAEAHLGNIDTGIDVLEACVGSNKVNVNISSGTITLPTGAATEAKQDTLEASLTSIEGKIDVFDAVLDASLVKQTSIEGLIGTLDGVVDNILSKNTDAETHLGNIDTGIDVLEACVGSNKVNVNISSGNISGFATDTLQGTTNSKLDTLEASLTSMEGKQDTQVTHLSEIEGAVETLEGCVSGSEVQVDVVGSLPAGTNNIGDVDVASVAAGTNRIGMVAIKANEAADGSGTERHLLCDSAGHLQVDIVSGGGGGDASASNQVTINNSIATLDAVVDNILIKSTDAEAHLGNIDTGIDVLEACVGSNKVNVNISSGNITGFATAAHQVTAQGKLDTLETTLTAIETDQAALEVLHTSTNSKLDTIDSVLDNILSKNTDAETHLGNIDTGIDVLEACVGSNKVNVNISSGNITGFATSAHQVTIQGKLDTLETTLTAIETDQAALEVLHTSTNSKLDTMDTVLDNIKVDTEAIETAVEALNARDSLTTTLIIDGQTVSSSGTHTSSSFEVTNINRSGKLQFLVRISGVSVPDISVAVQLSADNTNFFGADLGMITQGISTSGDAQFISCNFAAKHVKIKLSNSNGSSAATCTVHMFN